MDFDWSRSQCLREVELHCNKLVQGTGKEHWLGGVLQPVGQAVGEGVAC